jgi:hypothetical protein
MFNVLYMPLINLSSLGLKPPLITLDKCTVEDIVAIVDKLKLSKSEKALLATVKKSINSSDAAYTNAEIVSKSMGRSEGAIRQTLKKLVGKGVFDERFCQTHPEKIRRSSLFVFIGERDESVVEAEEQVLIKFEDRHISKMFPDVELDYFGRADDVICRFLFAALEYNQKSHERSSKVLIYIDKEPVWVEARTDGDRIALLRDLRYYLAVLSLCENMMELRVKAANAGLFDYGDVKNSIFDIREIDLLKTSLLGTGSGERENMKLSMFRLEGTNYHINNPSIDLMNKFGIKERRVKISHFDIVDYSKSVDNRVRYKLELPQRIVDSMFISVTSGLSVFRKTDPRLYGESNALKLALMLWATYIPDGKIVAHSWESLKDNVYPKQSMREFKKETLNLLKANVSYIIDAETEKYVVGDDGRFLLSIDEHLGRVTYCRSEIYGVSITYSDADGYGEFRIRKTISPAVIGAKVKSSGIGTRKVRSIEKRKT